jgi:perosamine synthetase
MIAHNRPTVGQPELQAVERVISSGWLAQGKEVELFENEVCEYLELERGHAVALSSGTAALFLALWALGAKGKRVAIPVYSCAAVRNAVLMAGAEPYPVDVGVDSPNIDFSQIQKGSAQFAVLAHIFGIPSRYPQSGLAIPTIEDCAQSFGARIDGRPVGVNGTVGIFSFYATKMITAGGQGGMLVSKDSAIVAAVRDYREFDCRRDRKPRFNLQITDLQAAVARAQLSRVASFITRRREIDAQYRAAGLPIWPQSLEQGMQSNHYRAIVRTPGAARVIRAMRGAGIAAIVPIEDWELLDEGQSARALKLAQSTLSLPIYPSLSDSAVADIISAATTSQLDSV